MKKSKIATFYVTIQKEQLPRFIKWQSKWNTAILGFDGFISLEFLSSPSQELSFRIVQRFANSESLSFWNDSEIRKTLIEKLKELTLDGKIEEKIEDESYIKTGVTEVIITEILPEHEKDYQKWSAKIHQIEANFPGFLGVYVQSPHTTLGKHWITILQFDTSENLDFWLNSKERQKILKESEHMTFSSETHRVISPYAGWFYSAPNAEAIASVWKQTMIVLLVLFPLVMLQGTYLMPLLSNFNRSFSTFLSNAISVTLLSFPLIPIAISLLTWWLYPERKNKLQINIVGTLVIILLYMLEIAIFWHLK